MVKREFAHNPLRAHRLQLFTMPATFPTCDPPTLDTARITRIRRNLLRWYDAHRRDLPWRRKPQPYTTWISEIMLQQTQVATVLPYYRRFLRAFPTVRALAEAPLNEVLQHWAGLGYYSRARNLHRAAQVVCQDFDGLFPESYEGLRTLPGIGDYTAGAIASICFGERQPAVDGNVLRVVARLTHCAEPINLPAGKAIIRAATVEMLPHKRVGDFNQALMELGARVCRPGNAAACERCPVRNQCEALAAERVSALPVKIKKTPARSQDWVVVAVRHKDVFLLRRRPTDGLWGGLWELPTAVVQGCRIDRAAGALVRELLPKKQKSRRVATPHAFGSVVHQLTHRRITFHGFHQRVTVRPATNGKVEHCWVTPNEARALGISTAMQKVFDLLESASTLAD